MTAVPERKLTAAEYLAAEREAAFKSEFHDGVLYPVHDPYGSAPQAMAGASPEHNTVKENLVGELFGRLKGGPCRSYSSDQRVRLTDTGMYAYPDVLIVCGPAERSPDDPNTITNPQVVFEVLSPSTERYDRGFKFAQYRRQGSIREVVFANLDAVRLERFVRQADETWLLTIFADPAGEFALASVPVRVPMADLYRGVEFPPAADNPRPVVTR